MKVIALRRWNDLKEGVARNEGDVFEVSEERYAEITAYRSDLVNPYESEPEAADEQPEPEAEPAPAPEKKRKTRAKAAK